MQSGRLYIAFTRGNDWSVRLKFREPPAGSLGARRIYGAGPPSDSTGANGDFFIDADADVSYGPKASGVWPSSVALPTIDYSSCTFAAQLRVYEDHPDAVDLTVDDTDSDTGEIVLSISNAESRDLGREYAWDLQMTDGSGLVSTPLSGTADVSLDVTREAVS